MSKNSAGKGCVYRPVNRKRYEENYRRIFERYCPYCKQWVKKTEPCKCKYTN